WTHTGNSLEWVDVTLSRKLAVEMARVSSGLDNTNVNVMICDRNYEVVYMNKMSAATLKKAEPLIQQGLPSFRADKVIGSCIDQYHKVPSAIRQILDNPQNLPRRSEIKVGALTLDLTASAIMNAQGEYLGNVVEWADVTAVKKALSEVDKLITTASAGQLSSRVDSAQFEGGYKALSEGINRLLDAVVAPLREAQGVLTALAANDLTQQMTGTYEGEFDQMKVSLNSAIQNLTATLATVRTTAESVSNGAEEITTGNEDLSQRTSEQAGSLEETSSAMEEMTSTVKQNADNAKQANQLAIAARDVAEKGGAVTTQAICAMEEINKSSKKIADIITVIDEIAFQTNLLALNAAVEAARAGEHGRGFAVVAAEVRNLAQRSATAAKEIKGLINESVQRVTDGSELVDQSGKTLTEIVGSVKRVTDIIAEISAASQEQASGIDQVNKSIMEMDQTTQQNAALVEEATSASQSMKEQAQELMRQVSSFQLTQTGQGQQPAAIQASRKPSGLAAGLVKKPLFTKPAAPTKVQARPESSAAAQSKDHPLKGGEFEEF
ncbi:MAG: methyl-accepting chemotaxis protein, partial [Nitrospirae bacterium]|nr:methyl-accepting chemotaxis protein [Nitrospirota bacterium]